MPSIQLGPASDHRETRRRRGRGGLGTDRRREGRPGGSELYTIGQRDIGVRGGSGGETGVRCEDGMIRERGSRGERTEGVRQGEREDRTKGEPRRRRSTTGDGRSTGHAGVEELQYSVFRSLAPPLSRSHTHTDRGTRIGQPTKTGSNISHLMSAPLTSHNTLQTDTHSHTLFNLFMSAELGMCI